jgi:membrane-associated protease RseP (regulator of RpoE activity)
MDGPAAPSDAPSAGEIRSLFLTYQVRRDGDRLLYVGDPLVPSEVVERDLWETFREHGYDVSLEREYDPDGDVAVPAHGWVLVAEPRSIGIDGVPWTNVAFALATLASTFLVGAVEWYGVDALTSPLGIFRAWPFVAAVLGVLAVHELGHYVAGRYHAVDASLPYFIPFPTIIGTMGAVIRMKGRIPSRKALFDIGAAGPLAGLVATVVVTVIGLQLDPLPAQQAAEQAGEGVLIRFNNPPLLELIAMATGTTAKLQGGPVHPVVFGGWVGMFITFLNLIPVGQLDGGHIVRAMIGPSQESVAAFVPGVLFALAGYVYFVRDVPNSTGIWALWGLIAMGVAYAGPATPVADSPIDRRRLAVGAITLVLGILCFTPVPFEVVAGA